MSITRDLIEAINDVLHPELLLDEVFLRDRLDEGRWIPTKSKGSIRIDQPTHGVGQTHAHVYGRKGQEIGVINLDGTPSHGTRMRLSKQDAEALRAAGFTVRHDRLVEWIVLPGVTWDQLLLG